MGASGGWAELFGVDAGTERKVLVLRSDWTRLDRLQLAEQIVRQALAMVGRSGQFVWLRTESPRPSVVRHLCVRLRSPLFGPALERVRMRIGDTAELARCLSELLNRETELADEPRMRHVALLVSGFFESSRVRVVALLPDSVQVARAMSRHPVINHA